MQSAHTDIAELVESGYRHHVAGRLEEAGRHYREALQRDPRQPRALGLAGALALQLGDWRSAARLLEAAVKVAPDESGNWNNLGAARVHLGDRAAAAEAYRRAIDADPGQFDARNNLGSLLLTGGDPRGAVPVLREALDIRPGDSGCRRTYAAALRAAGDPWRACTELVTVEKDEAGDPDYWRELAEARADIDDHTGAEVAWRRLLDHRAEDREALAGLSAALRGQERYGDAAEIVDRAIELAPSDAELWIRKGNILLADERYADAGNAFEQALADSPGNVSARLNAGIARLKQGDLDAAARWFDDLGDSYPSLARIRYYQALTALSRGEPGKALQGFEAALADDPLHINSIWYRQHCLYELGRDDEARAVMDPSRDVMSLSPLEEKPAADQQAFLDELTRFVTEFPQQRWEPAGSTTRGGHQTPSLPLHEPEVTRRFEAMVREAVERYVAALPEDHALRANWPASVSLSVWGTMLRRGGHQKPHIHPGGVLSGVFYTRLPEPTDAEPNAGWIEFGGPPYGTPTSYEPATRRVEPSPGLLVIFPSYLPHSTVPFDSETLRVSVAFDVMPIR